MIESDQSDTYHLAVVTLTDGGQTLDARNNIIAIFPQTPGATPSNVGLIESNDNAYFGTNWISSGYTLTDNGSTLTGNVGGLSNLITGSGADPGFVDAADNNFQLTSTAAALNQGGPLAGSAAAYPVTEEYVAPQSGQTRNNINDLGGFAYNNTPTSGSDTLSVSAPASVTAGSSFTVTVTALTSSGTTDTGYTGTVKFTSTDALAGLPANYTFTSANDGVATFTVTLKTAGSQSITATAVATGSVTGQATTPVAAAAASVLSVSDASTATAGTGFNVTVTAKDAYGNTATGYTGTIKFTSTDGQAVLPANYTFTSANAGTHTFSVTLKTAGSESVTATDTSTSTITGSASTTVSAAAASVFAVSDASTATAGTAFNVTVTAKDAYGNVATGYTGTVKLTSTDGQAVLPANYTFTTANAGTHTFSVTLETAGSQSVTATDTTTSSITGSASTTVSAASAFAVSAPSTATAGSSFSVTVTALTSSGATATGYTGTVKLTSSDALAGLPGNYTFTSRQRGNSHIQCDAEKGGLGVGDGHRYEDRYDHRQCVHDRFGGRGQRVRDVEAASTAMAGTAFNVTVTAKDAYGNTVTGYTGTIKFTSTDGKAVLPGNYTFTSANAGTHTFSVTLKTAGSYPVTATDTTTSTITGGASTTVSAAAASVFAVSDASTATAGTAFNVTVTAKDAYGNVATGYTGTVKLTSTDGQAVLPANYTFTTANAGTHTFSVTLETAGSQSVTVTDTTTSSITGSASTTVSAAVSTSASSFAVSAPSTATAGSSFSVTVTALTSSAPRPPVTRARSRSPAPTVWPGYRPTTRSPAPTREPTRSV